MNHLSIGAVIRAALVFNFRDERSKAMNDLHIQPLPSSEPDPTSASAPDPASASAPDPFPASDFDQWAGQYDESVSVDSFPFTGYPRVLAGVVRLAEARPGMSVLDLGVGTGNLAALFLPLGCELWATDFSTEMLARARLKLPAAQLFIHDLRQPCPPDLQRRFDRIVSAYVFHHFELPEKVALFTRLFHDHLTPAGRLIVADLSFPTRADLAAVRQAAGDNWDDEPYWIAAEALPALERAGLNVAYAQISDCAGIYHIAKPVT